jgi:hypothetical protein
MPDAQPSALAPEQDRLGEIEQLPKASALRPGWQLQRIDERPQVGAGMTEQCNRMSCQQVLEPWRQQRVRRLKLLTIESRKDMFRCGATNRKRPYLDPSRTQGQHLALDERVRRRGVLIRDVTNGAHWAGPDGRSARGRAIMTRSPTTPARGR